MLSKLSSRIVALLAFSRVVAAFAPLQQGILPVVVDDVRSVSTVALHMAKDDDDLLRWAKTSRSASAGDNVVELIRPIGVVLSEDEKGNVFVETLAPNGNAARSGKVITPLPVVWYYVP